MIETARMQIKEQVKTLETQISQVQVSLAEANNAVRRLQSKMD